MLYCNDELVNLKEPEWAYLKSEFAEIRKKKGSILIRTTQKRDVNATGIPEPIPPHAWPLRATLISDEGESQTWIYSQSFPSINEKTGVYEFKKSIQIDQGLLALDPIKETDKVYFLTKLSGLLRSGLFEIEDLDKKNTEEVEKLGANAAVEYFVCNKFSPIYNDHKRVRQLAASWGVVNTEVLHIDTVRKQLVDRVYASQRNYTVTKRGIEEFITEVNGDDPFSEYRTLIQLAIDKKVIGWNDKDKGWYFMDSVTNTFVQPLIFVQPIQLSQKNTILFDHVRLNANLFEAIKVAIHGNSNSEDGGYAHLGYEAKKELAKQRVIKTFRKTEDQITQELIEQDALKVS
jgi:hypothetical protein